MDGMFYTSLNFRTNHQPLSYFEYKPDTMEVYKSIITNTIL
jgi:hypothetical protein